jgi:hypothetical protein
LERFVMLENVSKSDLVAVVGLGLAAAVMSELLPNARPVIRSAIQFGVDLLTESEAEAEAELIQSLVSATLRGVRQDLWDTSSESDGREAVHARLRHFKQQARIRARRWGRDADDRHRRYRCHIARLEGSLARHKDDAVRERDRRVLDYAFEALAAEA